MLDILRRLTGYPPPIKRAVGTAMLNDAFRARPFGTPKSRILFSPGVMALSDGDGDTYDLAAAMLTQSHVLLLVRHAFADTTFNPTDLRDRGAVDYLGHTVLFRISYHSLTFDGPAEDPSDARKTARVMTLFLASEAERYG